MRNVTVNVEGTLWSVPCCGMQQAFEDYGNGIDRYPGSSEVLIAAGGRVIGHIDIVIKSLDREDAKENARYLSTISD